MHMTLYGSSKSDYNKDFVDITTQIRSYYSFIYVVTFHFFNFLLFRKGTLNSLSSLGEWNFREDSCFFSYTNIYRRTFPLVERVRGSLDFMFNFFFFVSFI